MSGRTKSSSSPNVPSKAMICGFFAAVVIVGYFTSTNVLYPYEVAGLPEGVAHPLACVKDSMYLNPSCDAPEYSHPLILRLMKYKWIHFVGDSLVRGVFYGFEELMRGHDDPDLMVNEKQYGLYTVRIATSTISFQYAPYFSNITYHINNVPTRFDLKPDLVVAGSSLHELLYKYPTYDEDFEEMVDKLKTIDHVPILWKTTHQILDDELKGHRLDASQFRDLNVRDLNKRQEEGLSSIPHIYVVDAYDPDSHRSPEKGDDGIHNSALSVQQAKGLVSALFWLAQDPEMPINLNASVTSAQKTCFLFFLMLFVSLAICEGSLIMYPSSFCTDVSGNDHELKSLVTVKTHDIGGTLSDTDEEDDLERNCPKNVTPETYLERLAFWYGYPRISSTDVRNTPLPQDALRAAVIFSLAMFYVYLNDGPKHLFGDALKHYDRDIFCFILLVVIVISYLTSRNTKNDTDKVLNREQTEEWKGIMQIVFVFYHYFDAGETYNLIRVFIAAYVWMTGYGNFFYFYHKKDFSLTRLFKMLFRLNFLVIVTCAVLDKDYILYYICPLHTFFFLVVYTTMFIRHRSNSNDIFMKFKLVVLANLLVILFIAVPDLFEIMFWPFRFLLKYHGTLYEWHFRTSLDPYVAFWGMVFAFNYSNFETFLQRIESKPRNVHIACKAGIGFICCFALFAWYQYVYVLPKLEYNTIHPYTSIIPIACYIVLRNLVQKYRQRVSLLLVWLGKVTLETYILQLHVYMCDDAKVLIVYPYLQGYPLLNFALASVIYVFLSKVIFDCTMKISDALIPRKSSNSESLLRVGAISSLVVSFLGVISFMNK